MKKLAKDAKIVLLHHSTGNCVWGGGVPEWFDKYNVDNAANYQISEMAFPKQEPYGWRNYPYDYWNIWVNNAGDEPFTQEPTLEMLTKDYDVIIFKHCFPVSCVEPDDGAPDITSDKKTLANYKLQYNALKAKMHEFPATRFIVWTSPALSRKRKNDDVLVDRDIDQAKRSAEFVAWVKDEWNEADDNIFVWDFNVIETAGGLFVATEFGASETDSHPNDECSRKAAPALCEAIVSAIKS